MPDATRAENARAEETQAESVRTESVRTENAQAEDARTGETQAERAGKKGAKKPAKKPGEVSAKKPAKKPAKKRDLHKLQVATQLLVLVAVLASLAFDIGLGTPSSFGVGQFFLLCPLGALEAFVASKSFLPITLVSFAVVCVLSLVLGRAWCAWGCPAPVIRRFFKRDPKQADIVGSPQGIGELADLPIASSPKQAAGCGGVKLAKSGLKAALKHWGKDRRTWVLVGMLVAACVVGFPIFCLVCPIGLTYGTVASLWHFIVDKQTTLSLIVFPAALAVELVLYKKWCTNLCPVAGFLGIIGQFARLFRPQIKADTCKNYNGEVCKVCTYVCPEGIDKHALDAATQLGTCMRCGKCVHACPTHSIHFEVKPGDPVVLEDS